MNPSIYSLCLHKGGSTFITAFFAPALAKELDLIHVPVEQVLLETGNHVTHAPYFRYHDYNHFYSRLYPLEANYLNFNGKRAFALQRDPRDIAVSWYYSIAYSHGDMPGMAGEKLSKDREILRKFSLQDGIKAKTADIAIREFKELSNIVATYPNIVLTRYENMVTDFVRWIDRLAGDLRLDVNCSRFYPLNKEFVVEQEDVTRHKRRVKPGNWMEVFDAELQQYFKNELGPLLEDAGYQW